MKNNKNNKNNLGFTIIELMVTILIISILSSIIINRITQSQAQSQADLLKVKIFSGTVKNRLIENLVAEWTLDDTGATIVNTSDYGADLNCTSYNTTPQTSANCINNGCLLFNGSSSYLNCGNNIAANITNAITVEAWVKTFAFGTNQYRTIVGRATGDIVDGCGLQYGLSSNWNNGDRLEFWAHKVGFTDCNGSAYVVSSPISLNVWYHVVGTYDSSTGLQKIYLNGIINATSNKTAGTLIRSYPNQILTIGRAPFASQWYFNGLIDEVRIYNAPLTIVEIQDHYYAGLNKLLAKGAITQLEYNQRVSALQAEVGYK